MNVSKKINKFIDITNKQITVDSLYKLYKMNIYWCPEK